MSAHRYAVVTEIKGEHGEWMWFDDTMCAYRMHSRLKWSEKISTEVSLHRCLTRTFYRHSIKRIVRVRGAK